MPASADTMRLALVPEAVIGQVPLNPAYEEMRLVSESINFAPTTATSNELGGTGRGVNDYILTGGQAAGDLAYELHKDPALEQLFAAALGNDWGADPIGAGMTGPDFVYTGKTMRTFTFEKRIEKNPSDYDFHRYHGMTPNVMQLTVTPNTPITGSFTFIGTTRETDTAEDVGSAYTPAPTWPIMTAPLVTAINLYDQQGNRALDVSTSCWTNLVINLNNNDRGIACIGTLGNHDIVMGKQVGEITYRILYASDFLLRAQDNQTDYKLVVELRDAPGNNYTFTFPRVRVGEVRVSATGTGTDIANEGNMGILVGNAPNIYPVLIQRGVPKAITQTHAVAGDQHSATITFGGGPADKGYSVAVTVTATGNTIAPVTVPVSAGDDKYEVARNVAAALNGTNLLATAVREVVTLGRAGSTTAITAVTVTIT